MYFDEEYNAAKESEDKRLQDDYLAALCVAMMFGQMSA